MELLDLAHFGAQIEGVVAGEAIGAEADVDAMLAQGLQGKGRMAEVGVALGAMDDGGAALRDQLVIVILEIIEMGDDAVAADDAVLDEMGQGRALAAIRVVPAQAGEEIVERAARVRKHFVLLDGLGDVGGAEHTVLFTAGPG